MSADNGIYIAKFPDGYRITNVVGNIENIDFFAEGTKKRKKELKRYFGKSKIFTTENEALVEARKIKEKWDKEEDEYGIGCPIEYGICFIGEYEDFKNDNR